MFFTVEGFKKESTKNEEIKVKTAVTIPERRKYLPIIFSR